MKTTELRKESMSPLSLIRAMVVTASIGCMALMMATLSGCDTEDDPGGEMDKDFPLVFSTNKLNFVDRFAQQFTLTNPGGEAVSYSAVSSEAWIELNTTSGTIAADGEAPVFVSVNTADMKAGSKYNGTITIVADGYKSTVAVTVTASDKESTFTDSRNNSITIPGGALACAARVISFEHGDPWTKDVKHQNPDGILGEPDGDEPENGIGSLCMGRYGLIVLGFDVYITDGEGMDIYVFEVGPDVEATKVEVSNDLKTWIHVGDAETSISGIDMRGKVPLGGKYQYVRLTDLRTYDHTTWPGADIDAVVALHPMKK